jgi:two-component system, OmpR family, manganese sensing sensor histidine kinase
MFQATRRRLAIWYTTVTAIVLVVFASGMYIYVRSTLIERIDDTLNHVVEVVNRSLAIDRQLPQLKIDVSASFKDNSDRVEDDRIDLELFSFDRRLLWSTTAEPLNLPIHVNPDGETVRVDGDRILRQICVPILRQGQLLGFLRVSHPWFEVTKPTQQLIVDLALGTLATLGTVTAIGWFLSGIAIEPVKASYQQLKQFTADASHELRNPIATIQTNVQVALSEEPLPSPQRQQLQTIERLTRRLGRLVDDLLFLARQDSGLVPPQIVAVPLDALLIEAVEEQQLAAAAKGIQLSLEIIDSAPKQTEPEDFTTLGDWDRLARLFTNLIDNAIQYTLSRADGSNPVTVTLQKTIEADRSYLQVRVKDRGIGIPDRDLPKLFDRFYRVDTARTANDSDFSGGTGLGLPIVRAIANECHGKIKIESQINLGTTVTVLLPENRSSYSL